MPTKDIARDQWTLYLNEFTERHAGQPINLEVMQDGVRQFVFEHMPLRGIAGKLNAVDDENISISAGGLDNVDAMHTVRRPTRVEVALTPDGTDEGLRIETADGGYLLLVLTQPTETGGIDAVRPN